MWRAAVFAVLLACLAVAGCGGDEPAADPAARHLDPRSDWVAALDLDVDGGNWDQVEQRYATLRIDGAPATLDGLLTQAAGASGLSYDDDVRPLLGGTVLAGLRTEPGRPAVLTLAYRVADAAALDRVLAALDDDGVERKPFPGVEDAERLGEGVALVGGDTLVAVLPFDEDEAEAEDVEPLLRARVAGDDAGPEPPELRDDLLAVRAVPSALGAWLDRVQLARALDTPPGRALRGAEARLRLDEDAARATARIDFEGLPDDELPLPAAAPLALPLGEGLVGASADQSLTTVFLARLARELYPDSRFVRRVEALEAREGLRFEDAVLRQFSGPSFSVLRPDAEDGQPAFGARSELRDPAAMRDLLERIAPDLPGILEGLQGLGSGGLAALLFVAPDAPLTPAAFALLAQVDVTRLAGDDALYEIRGLDREQPGPERVVYGIVDDAFVVASSEALAREVAAMETEPAGEAATRGRASRTAFAGLAAAFGVGDTVRALVDGAEASAAAQDGDIVAGAELRWRR